MKYILILLVAILSISCGGGETFSYYTPQTVGVREQVPVGYTESISGSTTQTTFDQRTLLTNVDDLNFYMRLFTGNAQAGAEAYFVNTKVLMIVHPRTLEQFYWTIDSITTDTIGTTLNVYYYFTSSTQENRVGERSFHFYIVPDTIGNVNYIEINK